MGLEQTGRYVGELARMYARRDPELARWLSESERELWLSAAAQGLFGGSMRAMVVMGGVSSFRRPVERLAG